MTHIFQPLHLTVNRYWKSFLRKNAQDCCSNKIRKEMEGTQALEIKVDIRISVLKPLHASWVTKFYDKTPNEIDIVLNGWKRFRITNDPVKVLLYFKKIINKWINRIFFNFTPLHFRYIFMFLFEITFSHVTTKKTLK